jgi:acetoin utilization protein AcuB
MTPLAPLTVADLMTRDPVRLRPDERLDIALALMVSCRFRHLPVEADGRLEGIVSLRDLYAADLPSGASRGARALHLRNVEARRVMSAPVISVAPGDAYLGAAQTLIARRISCLPVLEHGRLVGILSRADFLRPVAELLRREGDERGATTKVRAIMTPLPIATLEIGDHLDVGRTLMNTLHVRHLPVLDGKRIVGMVSDHDLLRAEASALEPRTRLERLRDDALIPVREVMSARVATVDCEDDAADAARTLSRRRLGALPVVSSHALVGIVTVSDFLHHLLSYAPQRAQAAAR